MNQTLAQDTTPNLNNESNKIGKPALLIIVLLTAVIAILATYLLLRPENTTPTNNVDNDTSQDEQMKSSLYSIKLISSSEGRYNLTLEKSGDSREITIDNNVSGASISPDNKTVAFVKEEIVDMETRGSVYMYDIESETTTLYLSEQKFISDVSWSPDGAYLLLESGTYIARRFTVVNYATKQEQTSFNTSENTQLGQYYWIDSDNIVFMTMSDVNDSENKPAGSGMLTEINRISVLTGEETQLAIPEVGMEYFFNDKEPANGKIEVRQVRYSGPLTVSETNILLLDLNDGTLSAIE